MEYNASIIGVGRPPNTRNHTTLYAFPIHSSVNARVQEPSVLSKFRLRNPGNSMANAKIHEAGIITWNGTCYPLKPFVHYGVCICLSIKPFTISIFCVVATVELKLCKHLICICFSLISYVELGCTYCFDLIFLVRVRYFHQKNYTLIFFSWLIAVKVEKKNALLHKR